MAQSRPLSRSLDLGKLGKPVRTIAFRAYSYELTYHHHTVLRRQGDWERYNLNQMLLNPFMNEVASSFADTMDSDMFATCKYQLSLAVYNFLKEFETVAKEKLQGPDRVSGPLEACQKNTDRIIENSISLVKVAVQNGRADISRSAVPSVKSKLETAYKTALAETGTGSINRQQVRGL